MTSIRLTRFFSWLLPALATLSACAQSVAPVTPAGPIPDAPQGAEVIRIYPGPAPGSENWTWHEQLAPKLSPWDQSGQQVRNVVVPTLTVFRPTAPANGAAVIIAPGGGFYFLSVESEGHAVARWLAARGYTCFVLRYRLRHTPESDLSYRQKAMQLLMQFQFSSPAERERLLGDSEDRAGVVDGAQAIRVVREHAANWGIDPHRIVILGFSAGGAVANWAALHHDAQSRPDFLGSIYAGFVKTPAIPDDAPPLFAAVAADDVLMGRSVPRLFEAWRDKKISAELHVYAAGGHGFGLIPKGTTSDHWIDEFSWWLQAQKVTQGR